jgi:hypothetical protein
VEFNSTGSLDYQGSAGDFTSIYRAYRAENVRRAGKRSTKNFNERRNGWKIITLFETKNDTLIRRYELGTEWMNRGAVDWAGF